MKLGHLALRGLFALVLTALSACGGGEASTEVGPSTAASASTSARSVTVAAAAASQTLTVRARADLFDGVGALMRVEVGGQVLGEVFVNATTDTDYSFTTDVDLVGAQVAIGFGNDQSTASQDRNLYVVSVQVGGRTIPATQGIWVNPGSGMDLPDALMMWSNGLVLIDLPMAPIHATGSGAHAYVVKAHADLFDGVGARMEVKVGGTSIGSLLVNELNDTDYTFYSDLAPAGARVDIGFLNDQSTPSQDRNLWVSSLSVGAVTVPATAGVLPSAIGAMQANRALVWSNGYLALQVPNADGPPTNSTGSGAHALVIQASASLFDGVGADMRVKVNGTPLGTLRVSSAADYTYRTDLDLTGATIDIAFTNDQATPTQDRNLYLRSVRVGSQSLQAVDGTFDPGSGARTQGQVLLWSNATLRLVLAGGTQTSSSEKVAAVRAAHDILARTSEVFPWMLATFSTPLDGSPEMGAVLPAATVCQGGGLTNVWADGLPVAVGAALPIQQVTLPGGVTERVRRVLDVYVEYRACVRGDTRLQGRSEALDLVESYPIFPQTRTKTYVQDLLLDRQRAGVTEHLDGRIRTRWDAAAQGGGRTLEQVVDGFRKLNANGSPAWKALSGGIARSSGSGFFGTVFNLTATAVTFEVGGKTYTLDGTVDQALPSAPAVTLVIKDASGQMAGALVWDRVNPVEPASLFAAPAYGVGFRVLVDGVEYSVDPS